MSLISQLNDALDHAMSKQRFIVPKTDFNRGHIENCLLFSRDSDDCLDKSVTVYDNEIDEYLPVKGIGFTGPGCQVCDEDTMYSQYQLEAYTLGFFSIMMKALIVYLLCMLGVLFFVNVYLPKSIESVESRQQSYQ